MNQTLTLAVPDRVYKVLWQEAQTQKKTVEQVALDWMAQRITPSKGSVEAIMPFFGSWKMTSEERARIEREIDEDRHRKEEIE